MITIERTILEQAVESSFNSIIITDALADDNPVIYVNAVFEAMTGFSAAETIGRNCRFLQHTRPRQKAVDDLREAIAAGRPISVTVRNIRKDGSLFWNDICVSPIRNTEGVITNFIGIQKDVTERVQHEKKIKELQHELRKANRELTDLVQLDSLTGLFNRRYFSEIFERDWQLALREGKYLSVLIFDIDFFKQYNDTCGQAAGDACLKTVAQTIRDGLKRATDILARYGGEEFIALLFDLTESRAADIAAAISASVGKLNLTHDLSAAAPHITLSAGVAACIPRQDILAEGMIKAATNALYQAKRQGRNQVVKANDVKDTLSIESMNSEEPSS
jgi:two-component system cell cycle response regulator